MKGVLWLRILALFLLALGVSGCKKGVESPLGDEGPRAKLKVTATTTIVADLVRSIGEDAINVVGIMGPGVDPHLYEITGSAIWDLKSADVVFYSGLHLEGKISEIYEGLEKKGILVAAVTRDIPKEDLIFPKNSDGSPGHPDPHVWGNPLLWKHCVDVVEEVLTKADPANADVFRRNAITYRYDLDQLDKHIAERIAAIPKKKRVLITSHDAFGYFGKQYDMEVISLMGISTAEDLGVGAKVALIQTIKDREIPAVFVESSVNSAAIEEVSRESKAINGGQLYSDSLGAPGETSKQKSGRNIRLDTYDGMMRHNTYRIYQSLVYRDAPAVAQPFNPRLDEDEIKELSTPPRDPE